MFPSELRTSVERATGSERNRNNIKKRNRHTKPSLTFETGQRVSIPLFRLCVDLWLGKSAGSGIGAVVGAWVEGVKGAGLVRAWMFSYIWEIPVPVVLPLCLSPPFFPFLVEGTSCHFNARLFRVIFVDCSFSFGFVCRLCLADRQVWDESRGTGRGIKV